MEDILSLILKCGSASLHEFGSHKHSWNYESYLSHTYAAVELVDSSQKRSELQGPSGMQAARQGPLDSLVSGWPA